MKYYLRNRHGFKTKTGKPLFLNLKSKYFYNTIAGNVQNKGVREMKVVDVSHKMSVYVPPLPPPNMRCVRFPFRKYSEYAYMEDFISHEVFQHLTGDRNDYIVPVIEFPECVRYSDLYRFQVNVQRTLQRMRLTPIHKIDARMHQVVCPEADVRCLDQSEVCLKLTDEQIISRLKTDPFYVYPESRL